MSGMHRVPCPSAVLALAILSAAACGGGGDAVGGVTVTPGPQIPAGNPGRPCAVPAAGLAEDVSRPTTVVGAGTPASCTPEAFEAAVARAGVVTFDCGPDPVTITLPREVKLVNDAGVGRNGDLVIDGGGKVTLSGGGRHRILYMNGCDQAQHWITDHCQDYPHPRLVVQNLTFADGAADDPALGGGAIYARSGQLKVVNSVFLGNRCATTGPDVAGGAIYAVQQAGPVHVVDSTFGAPGRGNVGSNGGALGSIGVSWTVTERGLHGQPGGRNRPEPGARRHSRGRKRRRDLQRREHLHAHGLRERGVRELRPRARRSSVLREQRPDWFGRHRPVHVPLESRHRRPVPARVLRAFRSDDGHGIHDRVGPGVIHPGMADKIAVAGALRELGLLLEVQGENPFKVRAYENGARALEELPGDLDEVIAAGTLTELPGIGKALAGKIEELARTGRLELLDRVRGQLPAGIGELLRIPDLGPKKIAALHAALGIAGVDELAAACKDGRVREVKGFGEKTERKILDGIHRMRTAATRFRLSDAREIGYKLVRLLRATGAADRVELAGSARRWKETVGDLDIVASSVEPARLSDALAAAPGVESVVAKGDTKTTVRLAGGLSVDLRVVPPAEYASLLHHMTGSKEHNVRLRGLARDLGFTLSEWGLERLDGGGKVPIQAEEDVYRALGLEPVPPELRQDSGEIEAAREGRLPTDLVTVEDVKGMVHVHTSWSDGRASIEEMARAAEDMGMEYLTVTDHSRSAAYAGGLDLARLEAQREEIARVQEKVGIRLLRGTEADILETGALDWPDAVLEKLDVIVASVHSRMKMDQEQMTRRMVRMLELPVFKIWGHATGRLLLEREPYGLDMEKVLDAAAASRVAIEVNGDPHRLDMEPRHLRLARERGIPLVLSTDAHSVAGLQNLPYAVMTARRAWVTRGEVLNTLPAAEFAARVRPG